jgi:hypothetical protein
MTEDTPKVKQISFKQQEFPLLIQQQRDLQKVYRLDISGLYKYLLREKHQEIFGVSVPPQRTPVEILVEVMP